MTVSIIGIFRQSHCGSDRVVLQRIFPLWYYRTEMRPSFGKPKKAQDRNCSILQKGSEFIFGDAPVLWVSLDRVLRENLLKYKSFWLLPPARDGWGRNLFSALVQQGQKSFFSWPSWCCADVAKGKLNVCDRFSCLTCQIASVVLFGLPLILKDPLTHVIEKFFHFASHTWNPDKNKLLLFFPFFSFFCMCKRTLTNFLSTLVWHFNVWLKLKQSDGWTPSGLFFLL